MKYTVALLFLVGFIAIGAAPIEEDTQDPSVADPEKETAPEEEALPGEPEEDDGEQEEDHGEEVTNDEPMAMNEDEEEDEEPENEVSDPKNDTRRGRRVRPHQCRRRYRYHGGGGFCKCYRRGIKCYVLVVLSRPGIRVCYVSHGRRHYYENKISACYRTYRLPSQAKLRANHCRQCERRPYYRQCIRYYKTAHYQACVKHHRHVCYWRCNKRAALNKCISKLRRFKWKHCHDYNVHV